MAKFRLGAIVMGAAMTAVFAGNAFAIESKADCEYQGGETFNINNDLICVIPIRAEEFHGEEYDDAQLGVKECDGTLIGDGLFCKLILTKGKKVTPKTADAVETAVETVKDKAEEAAADTKKSMMDQAKKAVTKKAKDAE